MCRRVFDNPILPRYTRMQLVLHSALRAMANLTVLAVGMLLLTVACLCEAAESSPSAHRHCKYNIGHLHQPHGYYAGPLQNDEALLLFSIITVTTPKTLVEFGFYAGDSARNALHAMMPDAMLFSYDVQDAWGKGKLLMQTDKRFKLYLKPGEQFSPADVKNRPIDMVFIDANHNPETSMAALKAILGTMAPHAILAVHDTGRHVMRWAFVIGSHNDGSCALLPDNAFGSCKEGAVYPFNATNCQLPYPQAEGPCECRCKDVSDAYGYCCSVPHSYGGERIFLRTMAEQMPEWRQLHLHSSWVYRHGVTLLQRDKLAGLPDASGIL